MISRQTQGVGVMVETFYQPDYSNPLQNEFMFAYRITITNRNPFPIKVMKRHWFIFDSDGTYREVEGEGVVGMQPVIQSGQEYEYVSGCNIHTEIGTMHGTYTVENQFNKELLEITIPKFEMIAPCKHN